MAKTASSMIELFSKAVDFQLPDIHGKLVSLKDFPDAKGFLIMFICNHCPYVVHVRDALLTAVKAFQEHGIAVIAVSSNDAKAYPEDAPEKMREYALRYHFSFPYLFDESQDVAKAYQAACTPDFFLYDAQKSLVYRGQMDDSRPGNGVPNDAKDLKAAVEALLTNQVPLALQKPSIGCNIKWRSTER